MAIQNIAYANFATITISLASVATSATPITGREATALTNSTFLYVDALLSGFITVGTTPTINTQILVYVLAALDATPTWPDVFDGTDSAETLTSLGLGQAFLKQVATINVDATTSNVAYPFGPVGIAQFFGGNMPRDWTLFVTHNTGVNLNSTGGNHVIKYQGITYTVA